MIVDTSALVAIVRREEGFAALLNAILTGPSFIPSPVLIEFDRVTAEAGNTPHRDAAIMLDRLAESGTIVEPMTAADARTACAANEAFGTGNGRGGVLNMLDLMVYGMARRLDLPILCTGKDFPVTDIAVHPASRSW